MIAFWAVVAALIAVALLFVIRPLVVKRARSDVARGGANISIYRDQMRELDADLQNGLLSAEQHEKARRELEGRLLEDAAIADAPHAPQRPAFKSAIVLSTLVPIGAFCVYLLVGTPAALDPQVLAQNSAEHTINRQELEAMVEKLAARLKEQPDNPEGWVMLGRSYKHFQRYEDAARAYGNAISRMPPNADVLADYADILAMAQGRQLAGEPEKVIAQALKADPKNLKALALAGSAAFDRKDFAGAARYWEQMLPLVQADSEQARAIQANVDEARGLGGIAASTPAVPRQASAASAAQQTSAPQSSGSGKVSGTVELAPELRQKVAPTDTVLIYARAAEGSRMPLAIVRKQARDLPAAFTLDDSMAMQPGMTLSKNEKVVIAARVSKSSSASAQPGDLEGISAPIRNTASGITVVINSEIR
jgi:cytochrome c-type biogenesis protein CcmH